MSYLACAAGCTIRDQHYDSCTDLSCRGCVERGADVGCLCLRCFRGLEIAWSEWAILEPYLVKYARLSPRNEDGSRSPAGPSVPLPQTALSWDEVRSWLRDEPQNARAWVSTVEGAQHAVGFTRAVQRAVRAHQIEDRPKHLQRMRCTCGSLVVWLPPQNVGDLAEVRCESCGRTVTEEDQWKTYVKTTEGWEGRLQPAIDVVAEIETGRKSVMTVMDEGETA